MGSVGPPAEEKYALRDPTRSLNRQGMTNLYSFPVLKKWGYCLPEPAASENGGEQHGIGAQSPSGEGPALL